MRIEQTTPDPARVAALRSSRWSVGAVAVVLAVSAAGAFFEWVSPDPRRQKQRRH
jgi:hypothetical protein